MPWDGRSHYLAAVYRTDLADRIDALVAAGERRMSALIDASDAQQIVLPDSRCVDQRQHRRRLARPGAAWSLKGHRRLSPPFELVLRFLVISRYYTRSLTIRD